MDRYYASESAAVDVAPRVSLRSVIDDATYNARQAHELIDQLEDRILGSRPRPVEGIKSAEPQSHPGLRIASENVATTTGALAKRLQELLGEL